MEKKEIIDKLTNLKGALYLLYKNYEVIQKRMEFDDNFWKVDLNRSYRDKIYGEEKMFSSIRVHWTEIPFPYKNGEFDVLGNFMEMYKGSYFDINKIKKIKWYKLLFGWVGVSSNKEMKDLFKFRSVLGDGFNYLWFHFFRKNNVKTLEVELVILNDINNNLQHPINKELKLNKSKIEKYKKIIKDELERNKSYLEMYVDEVKSYGYDLCCTRTKNEITEDEKMLQLLDNIRLNLSNEFDIISPSDWKNIDGIIYMFETGRADTIKEALNLYDQRQYAEMIVGAINSLNRTIAHKLSSLEASINANFSVLFGKIDATNSQLQLINNRLGELKELEDMSSERLSQNLLDITSNIKEMNLKSDEINNRLKKYSE